MTLPAPPDAAVDHTVNPAADPTSTSSGDLGRRRAADSRPRRGRDVSLPPLLVLTDRRLAAPRPLADVVARAVAGGARAVVVREKDLPPDERAALVATIAESVRPVGGVVLSASTAFPGADGIHLDARQEMPADRPAVVGRSCHDLDEVRAAEAEGCDYVTLSPVFRTASKPGYGPPLGLAELARVCAAVDIAVYALGGVLARHARSCIDAGAAGVAVMGAVMSADRPEAATADLCRLLEPSATSGPRGKEPHA